MLPLLLLIATAFAQNQAADLVLKNANIYTADAKLNGLHPFGVDDIASRLRQIAFSVWVTLNEHKWVIHSFLPNAGDPNPS